MSHDTLLPNQPLRTCKFQCVGAFQTLFEVISSLTDVTMCAQGKAIRNCLVRANFKTARLQQSASCDFIS
jgi:hypothetical protein